MAWVRVETADPGARVHTQSNGTQNSIEGAKRSAGSLCFSDISFI